MFSADEFIFQPKHFHVSDLCVCGHVNSSTKVPIDLEYLYNLEYLTNYLTVCCLLTLPDGAVVPILLEPRLSSYELKADNFSRACRVPLEVSNYWSHLMIRLFIQAILISSLRMSLIKSKYLSRNSKRKTRTNRNKVEIETKFSSNQPSSWLQCALSLHKLNDNAGSSFCGHSVVCLFLWWHYWKLNIKSLIFLCGIVMQILFC